MRCTQCGKELPDSAKFCTGCGAKVERSPNEQDIHGWNLYGRNSYSQDEYEDEDEYADVYDEDEDKDRSGIQKLKKGWKDLYTVIVIVVVLLVAALVGLAVKKMNAPADTKEVDEIQSILDEEEETVEEEPVEEETVEEEPEEESLLDQDYVIPNSDSVYLTLTDLDGMTIQEINYAKNEIYARHGRKFKSKELMEYFSSKSWYQGTYEPDDFDANYSGSVLNDYEKKNAELLGKAEFSMNPDGYQLDQ